MTTAPPADAFTPERAALALDEVRTLVDGVRRRTEGAVLMIWGIVISAALAGATAGILLADRFPALWPLPVVGPALAFVLAGAAATAAIWRAAALPANAERSPLAKAARAAGALVAAIVVLWLAASVAASGAIDLDMLAMLGLVTGILAWINAFGFSARGRRTLAGIALSQIAIGLALSIAPVPDAALVAIELLAAGGAWLAGGAVETLSG